MSREGQKRQAGRGIFNMGRWVLEATRPFPESEAAAGGGPRGRSRLCSGDGRENYTPSK